MMAWCGDQMASHSRRQSHTARGPYLSEQIRWVEDHVAGFNADTINELEMRFNVGEKMSKGVDTKHITIFNNYIPVITCFKKQQQGGKVITGCSGSSGDLF